MWLGGQVSESLGWKELKTNPCFPPPHSPGCSGATVFLPRLDYTGAKTISAAELQSRKLPSVVGGVSTVCFFFFFFLLF